MSQHPMTRGDHYRHADRILRDYNSGYGPYDSDIPNLLRALTHAVLATAADDAAYEHLTTDPLDGQLERHTMTDRQTTNLRRQAHRHIGLANRMILAMLSEEVNGEDIDAFDLVADDVDRGDCCEPPAACWRGIAYLLAATAADHATCGGCCTDTISRDEAATEIQDSIRQCLAVVARIDAGNEDNPA